MAVESVPSTRRYSWAESLPFLMAAVMTLLAIVALVMFDGVVRKDQQEAHRIKINGTLGIIRSRLLNSLTSPLLVSSGIVAQIVTHGDVSPPEFASLAQVMLDGRHSVRNITLSRGTTIAMVYPLAGNESVLGVDYRSRPTQWPIVAQAIESSEPYLQGPVDLIQGGSGLILRTPIFMGPKKTFFGMISIVIDIPEILAEAGLNGDEFPVNVAIRGRDGTGEAKTAFFGDDRIFQRSPVEMDVHFPHGTWHLAAEPKGEFLADDGQNLVRWLGTGLVLLVSFASFGTAIHNAHHARLSRELEAGNRRIQELSRFNARIITESAVGMVAFTADGDCIVANQAATRVIGCKSEDLLGRNYRQIALWQTGGLLPLAKAALITGEIQHFSGRIQTSSGRNLWLEGDFSTFMVDDIANLLFAFHDVSDRVAADRAIQEKTLQLERSNADLERFAYVASHDLQTPLRNMACFAQLLERRYRGRLDADADEFIGFIVSGAQKMSELILDILDYARISGSGKSLTPISARQAVDAALDLLKADLDRVDARITIGPMPVVLGDETQMVSLFQNLISNSLRYRSPDRAVEVSISAEVHEGDKWRIAVNDNGIGIEEEYFDNIFKMFHRLDPSHHQEGTGIGLAVCKKIVQRWGGSIWVSSKVGQGTTFNFTAQDAQAEEA